MVGYVFQKQIDWEGYKSNQNAIAPLGASQSIIVHLHEFSKELCAQNLDDYNDGPYDHESWVGEDTIKDVNLVVDLS
jgi:hypothetical protein